MNLSQLAGNEPVKRQLELQNARRGLSHAYILSGPPGSGRHTLAGLLCAALVCAARGDNLPCGHCAACRKVQGGIHPDVVRIGGDGKDVTVAQVRQMRADAWIRPNEAARKVYVLERAHSMNAGAQDAMLKLLEEGPDYAAFLLIADNADALLPTVRSRCEVLRLTPVSAPEADADLAQAAGELLDCLARGEELRLLETCIPLEKWERERFAALLEELSAQICAGLTGAGGQALAALPPRRLLAAADHVEKLRAACGYHVGTGHLAGWLCAGLCAQES